MSSFLTSHNVCLPGQPPAPATVEFSPATGKIVAITPGHRSVAGASYTDVGEAFVLPGLVECVGSCFNRA